MPTDGVGPDELLRLAAATEHASEHPVARAIAERGRAGSARCRPSSASRNRAGLGVQALVDGHDVVVGRPAFLAEWGIDLPDDLTAEQHRLEADRRHGRRGRAGTAQLAA